MQGRAELGLEAGTDAETEAGAGHLVAVRGRIFHRRNRAHHGYQSNSHKGPAAPRALQSFKDTDSARTRFGEPQRSASGPIRETDLLMHQQDSLQTGASDVARFSICWTTLSIMPT